MSSALIVWSAKNCVLPTGGAVGLSYALMNGNGLTKVLGSVFRVIGGPNLVATLLKTPGKL